MRPSFYPKMVNGPFDDPGVFVPFLFQHRAILFDLGEIHTLSARDILRISHIFVSHTHIDHFTGFDRILRVCLGREKRLCIYGPEGFLTHIEGKLSGYCWNLVQHYETNFIIEATEVRKDRLISREYPCRQGFKSSGSIERPFSGILLQEPSLSVSAIILDHGIPCLGFCLEEKFHINILKNEMEKLHLAAGPWLKQFKDAIFGGEAPMSEIGAMSEDNTVREFRLGELSDRIALISPGQKISYVTDVLYSEENINHIIALAKNSDYLFIEAAFSDKDKELASRKYHLTARQAGDIAAKATVRSLNIFHFSPRYTGMESVLYEEAETSFKNGGLK